MTDRIVVQEFSTRDYPAPARLSAWNRFIGDVFPGTTVRSEAAIRASWSQCHAGDLNLAEGRSQKAFVRCEPLRGHAGKRLLAHLQLRGSSLISQGAHAIGLSPGDLMIMCEAEPYSLALSENNAMLVMNLSGERAGAAAAPFITARAADSRLNSVLRDFSLSVLMRGRQGGYDHDEAQALGAALGRMLDGLFRPGERPPGVSIHERSRDRVLRFVEDHLIEPDLKTGMIAGTLGLSVRTVQDVFADMATTPTSHVRARRLARAAQALRSEADFGSITDLALDLGFSDSSYFSRCFRAEFGMSPGRYRHLQRTGPRPAPGPDSRLSGF
jgi:AraC-like DNA-binding protein